MYFSLQTVIIVLQCMNYILSDRVTQFGVQDYSEIYATSLFFLTCIYSTDFRPFSMFRKNTLLTLRGFE